MKLDLDLPDICIKYTGKCFNMAKFQKIQLQFFLKVVILSMIKTLIHSIISSFSAVTLQWKQINTI